MQGVTSSIFQKDREGRSSNLENAGNPEKLDKIEDLNTSENPEMSTTDHPEKPEMSTTDPKKPESQTEPENPEMSTKEEPEIFASQSEPENPEATTKNPEKSEKLTEISATKPPSGGSSNEILDLKNPDEKTGNLEEVLLSLLEEVSIYGK